MSTTFSHVPPSIDHTGRTERKSELSLTQEQIWVFEQFTPGTAVYNFPLALHFEGHLDVTVLERSLTEIVRRHEVLRASFRSVDGRVVQVVGEVPTVMLPRIDVPEGVGADHLERTRHACRADCCRPFDLVNGPLIRFTLFRLSPVEQVLLITAHHLVFDGWSCGVFLHELVAIYDAFSKDQPFPLPRLSIQYSDFASTQRQRLEGKVLENHVSFWRRKLEGGPPRLALPSDHPAPSKRNHSGARYPLELGGALTTSLKALGRGEGPTLFITLLAALVTLVYRYTRATDVTVGTAVAGRLQASTRTLIGCFSNILVLRSDVSGEPTFRELLDRLFRTAFEAFYHQELPFQNVVSQLNTERVLSKSPLFQVMLILHDYPVPLVAMPGLSVEPLDIHTGTAMFDLTLELQERQGCLVGWFEYDSELFEVETIARMAGHFQTLLEGAIKDPERRVSELPLLTASERHRLLIEFNATVRPVPETTLPELFEGQAARTPEAIAVICGTKSLSYAELNARANRLAHHLRSLGVGPEVRVGTYLERSTEMVVGLLGVLKAGAAYVPLDLVTPQQRLGVMLRDAQARVLLTQRRLRFRLPDLDVRVVDLESDWDSIAQENPENLATEIDSGNLAYVMYAEGPAGQPEGIAATHRGAVNRLAWMWAAYPFNPREVCCVRATLGSVDSVWEIFGPLLGGVPTVILTDHQLHDVDRLVAALADRRVTRLVLGPSLLASLLDATGDLGPRLPELRHYVITGGLLGADLATRFRRAVPGGTLIYMYGSTEVAGGVTCYDVSAMAPQSGIPLGRPIWNTRVYVLDEQLEPVPVGVAGELYIAGAGLARGYLGRPSLTAERFMADPHNPEPGSRMYRTGDLARWRSADELEYLGRADQQVTISGFRIEPAEIDRTALPRPDGAGLALCGNCTAPRSPTEVEMVAIWAEVFQLSQVGIHDNFFDLGGRSLTALRLLSLIRERFKINLPLESLFLHPTIAQLTELVAPPPDREPAKWSSTTVRASWVRFASSLTKLFTIFK